MGFLAWTATAAAGYLAVGFWLVMGADAWRRRRPAGAAVLAAALGAAWLAGRAAPGGGVGGVLAVAAALVVGSVVYYLAWPYREADWKRARVRRADAQQVSYHLVLLTGAALFALPFLWLVMTSLKPDSQIFAAPLAAPHPVRWDNYPRSLEFLEKALPVGTMYGLRFVGNTLYVTALSLVAVLFSSSLVAYSFARLRWPGRDALFVVLLATMMLPAAVTMIPTFLIYKQLGWVDTLRPLWFGGLFGGAFNVFLLRQFFLTIPGDLEDAAKIDGCSYFTIYWRIMLPLIKPALAALAILHFMGSWNDFMGPLIYISSPELMTGSYALQLFRSAHTAEWALLTAAATLWTIPVLVLFFCTQRYFIQGITLTGIKG